MNSVKIAICGLLGSLCLGVAGSAEAASGNGIITVTSEPTGVHFSLTSFGVRLTGVTPASFDGLATGSYTVSFSPVTDCRLARPQTRALTENGRIAFHGDYLCKDEMPVAVPTNTTPTDAAVRSEQVNIRLWNTFQQSETLPGNSALVTIGVRNISTSTIRNLRLSQSFNPQQVHMPSVLPQGGTLLAQQITWNIPGIYAGQSWTASFPVTMKPELQTGDIVQLIGQISGDDIQSPRGELLSQVAGIGISSLPETGARQLTLLATGIIAALAILTTTLTIRRKRTVELTV